MSAPQEGNEVRFPSGIEAVLEGVEDYGHDTHMRYYILDGISVYARPQDLEVLS